MLEINRSSILHYRWWLDAGRDVELFAPLYQATISIQPNRKEKRVDIYINTKKEWTHYFGTTSFTDTVLKDPHLTAVISFLIGNTEEIPSMVTGIQLVRPTILDRNSNDYINIIKSNLMPKISEKAVITTTGEISMKSGEELRDLKRANRAKKLLESKSKIAQKLITDIHYNNAISQRKGVSVIHNTEITKDQKRICVKHTDGKIGRMTVESAKELLLQEPTKYSYCSKLEWKTQVRTNKDQAEPLKGNPKYKQQSKKVYKETSKTSLRPKAGIIAPKVQFVKIAVPEKKELKERIKFEPVTETIMVDKHGILVEKTITKYAKKLVKIEVITPEHTKVKAIRVTHLKSPKTGQKSHNPVAHKLAIFDFFKTADSEEACAISSRRLPVGKVANEYHDNLSKNWKINNPEGRVLMHYMNDYSTKKYAEKITLTAALIQLNRKRKLPSAIKNKVWKFTPKKKGVK